ncbi:hypothetical protein DL771_009498 [Monosporascus sp. 5C6A]|nr:hypothetical protein DL771_009498 [Monosporascus sp. 5C6A]
MVVVKAAVATLALFTQAQSTLALWPGRPKGRDHGHAIGSRPSTSAARTLQDSVHQPTVYEIVLQELRQLESEPLCHRVAARLLVSNCELLEGKDEATILTDSGRRIRDFVDSYAASLAICDLERGSFVIPRECAKFREPVLNQLPTGNAAHLHVTSAEIDDCLSGLGSSDSAWNTWVSYRHKALRFCDAARADNDKAQQIMVFQRLAEIMKRMTDSVEKELEILDRLGERLRGIEAMLSGGLAGALEKSTDAVNGGIENAVSLRRMLETMTRDIMNSHAEAASAHEHSLQVMSRRAESEMETAMAMIAAAVTSSTALQNQIELSRLRAVELERRQDNLEHGLQRLVDVTEGLSTRYDHHTELLHRAQNMTSEILSTLQDTAASASFIGDSFSKHDSANSWWPYIWCPAASLVMGSYGLPPSALRNLGLLALGFIVSHVRFLSVGLPSQSMSDTEAARISGEPIEGFQDTQRDLATHPRTLDSRRRALRLRDEPVGQVRSPQVARRQKAVDLEEQDQGAHLELSRPRDAGPAVHLRRLYLVRALDRVDRPIGTCRLDSSSSHTNITPQPLQSS